MKKNPKLYFLIYSASVAPNHEQYISGILDNCKKIIGNKSVEARRLRNPFSLFMSSKFETKVLIYSPSLLNILVLFLAKLKGVSSFYWMHEPYPLSFIISRSNYSPKEFLKAFLLSYLYNPIMVILSSEIIFSSFTAKYSFESNFNGVIGNLLNIKYRFIPLPIKEEVFKFKCDKKENSIFVLNSNNTDKTIYSLLEIAESNPKLNFKILSRKDVYQNTIKNHSLRKLLYLKNVFFDLKENLSDSDIYEAISKSRFILLSYKNISQSGFLPIAFATGTIPIITNILGLRDNCYEVKEFVVTLKKDLLLEKQISKLDYEKRRIGLEKFSLENKKLVFKAIKSLLS